MRPPTRGIQASAAAMLEGSPVDFGESEAGGGGGGSSAMVYIHRMEARLVNSERIREQMVFLFPAIKTNTVWP